MTEQERKVYEKLLSRIDGSFDVSKADRGLSEQATAVSMLKEFLEAVEIRIAIVRSIDY